jgi:hypothetical protein
MDSGFGFKRSGSYPPIRSPIKDAESADAERATARSMRALPVFAIVMNGGRGATPASAALRLRPFSAMARKLEHD